MWKQDINCYNCGRFICTEQEGPADTEIRVVKGSYDNGFYDGEKDVFYCKQCAEKLGFLK